MTDSVDEQDAAAVAPLVDPDRLRLARELRGWTQAEVADRSGGSFTPAALSQLERGHTRPQPATLLAIAEVTNCPLSFFVARPGDQRREGFFRSLQATSARERRRHLADARLLHELIAVIEEHVDLPELHVPRFAPGPHSPEEIETIAERTRLAWRLDDGPLPNVVRVLERHGIVVVRASSFSREVDAFSVLHEGRPIIVLGTEKGVTARSRFDAAHELGHLVLHDDSNAGQRETENEAHQFAAAFLMPASDIRDELPATADWTELMRLKVRWRVSIAALLRRALTLDVMPKHSYTNAMKTLSARGWRTREPGDEKLGTLEAPVLLRLALEGLAENGIDVDALAEEASLPAVDVRRLIELTRDPRPRIRI
jgi:Zn-dependent peptidase ImmA (M78 family)/DNA-binding XRE family transcriptional regulator